MPAPTSSHPPARLVALDWGSTSLRAYLLGEGGKILDRRAEPWGILQLPEGGFRGAFDRRYLEPETSFAQYEISDRQANVRLCCGPE